MPARTAARRACSFRRIKGGGRVGGLTAIAHDTGGRGDDDEEVERTPSKALCMFHAPDTLDLMTSSYSWKVIFSKSTSYVMGSQHKSFHPVPLRGGHLLLWHHAGVDNSGDGR